MGAGRPTSYNEETAEAILEGLASGTPLKTICKREDMPCYMTVLRWQQANPDFSDLSARAKMHGTHALADECIEIADEKGVDPADKRVRIDTRIRLIGKWNSRAYGDKVAVGGDPDAPAIKVQKTLDVSGLSLEELTVLESALRATVVK